MRARKVLAPLSAALWATHTVRLKSQKPNQPAGVTHEPHKRGVPASCVRCGNGGGVGRKGRMLQPRRPKTLAARKSKGKVTIPPSFFLFFFGPAAAVARDIIKKK